MKKFYTVLFIRKSDNKVLKRYSSSPANLFFWKKEIEISLNRLLESYLDLERRDILVKEYEGTDDSDY